MRTPKVVWGLWIGLVAGSLILNAGTAYAGDEVQDLKEQVTNQQKQIEELRKALDEEKQLLQTVLAKVEAQSAHTAALKPTDGVEVASTVPMAPSRATEAAPASALPGAAVSPEALNAVQGQLATVAATATQTEAKVVTLESAFKDSQKSTEGLKSQLGNFKLSGDIRVRFEPFIQDGSPDRNRERIRARLNLTGKITDDISGGLSLASGDLAEPISTNQTLTGFYNRKPLGINLAYITVNPKGFKPLTLTGGKMTYPWYRTELTFDSDLNPEGFAEVLSFNIHNPVLKNVTFSGFQMPFNEVSGGYDSYLFGGQMQLNFRPTEKSKFSLNAAGINFNRADPIARALANKSLAGNSLTNAVVTDADGNVTGYASKFAYLELSMTAGYQITDRWPLSFGLDFVNNTRAANSERTGYLAEVGFGQTKKPKDLKVAYQYWHVERDAVLGAFNFSDLRQATNVQNHVFVFGYQIMKNVTGQWTYLLGKRLNDPVDNWLSRMQFDMVYSF